MLYVGQPVINTYSDLGYIAKIEEETADLFTIGATGMNKNGARVSVVFDSHVSKDLSEHILAPWIKRAEHLDGIPEDDVNFRVKMAESKQADSRLKQLEEREAAERSRADWEAEHAGKIPSWAKAAIVAHRRVDESDLYTDYHGSRTEESIILAFSKHTRDLFPEMRKAALNAEETQHLGPNCGHFSPRVCIATDFNGNGAYYHKGQYSPWHSEHSGHVFRTREEAQAYIDAAEPLGTMLDGETEVSFSWDIAEEEIEHREKYSMGGGYYLKDGYRHSTGWMVQKQPISSIKGLPQGRWNVPEKAAPAARKPAASFGAFEISEHVHTKRQCAVWLAVMTARVERDVFLELRSQAKALGGWYSRKWGNTPAGFMFLTLEAAEQFAGTDDTPAPPPKGNGDKLRERADKLSAQIESKRADRLENTPKRIGQAASTRLEADKLERRQKALYALADAQDAGTMPEALAGTMPTYATIDNLLRMEKEPVQNGFHMYYRETGEYKDKSAAGEALQGMIDGAKDPERAQAEQIKQAENAVKFSKIPGYFPTPAPVIAEMLSYADIEEGNRILEPSAGHGAIVDAIREAHGNSVSIDALEINGSLCEILKLKGHSPILGDFLDYWTAPDIAEFDRLYDRIIMNPPFENLADAAHVRFAFDLLAPNGRIVAIMGAGAFTNSQNKAERFRTWFEDIGGDAIPLPAGSFKESGTGVNTFLVVIDKPSHWNRENA